MTRRPTIIYLLLCLAASVGAQDFGIVFSQESYRAIVLKNHPIMRQANIATDMADPIRQEAKGGFDPVLDGNYATKQFSGTNYYRESYAAIKVPTWYNIELKADYERADGDFLDPSLTLPERGLWSAGLSVGLGRGFVIDERRAALKQADIYDAASQQERIIIINDLLYDAELAYLDWQRSYQEMLVAREGETLALTRLDATRESWRGGDKPAIDTLEALIALQNRQVMVSETMQNLENAEINLSFYLWDTDYAPLELADNSIPEPLQPRYLRTVMNSIAVDQGNVVEQHPEIQTYLYKIESLEVDRRLQREDIKPDIRLSYNPLISTTEDRIFAAPNAQDYKFGAGVYYPLLQRKARGKVQQTKLKIEDAEMGLQGKRLSILNKLNNYLNNSAAREEQLAVLEVNVGDYYRLLQAEGRKFNIGESSLFLINSREAKYLESQLKYISTTVKLIKDRLTYMYVAGEMQQVDN